MQMADRIKVLPLVVFTVLLVLGLILYWVSRRPRERTPDLDGRVADVPAAPAPIPAPSPTPVQGTPPPASTPLGTGAPNPGEKILEGADRAFRSEMYPTALKFYKD